MHSMLLTSDKDPMGAAIIDYLAHGKASKLRVFSSMFDEDEIPVNQLFRTFQEMPSLEQKALQLSTGKIGYRYRHIPSFRRGHEQTGRKRRPLTEFF